MKLTPERYEVILKIISENRKGIDRLNALKKSRRKFKLQWCGMSYRRTKIGFIHRYARSLRVQITCPIGYMRYAWMVIFDPMTEDEYYNFHRSLQ